MAKHMLLTPYVVLLKVFSLVCTTSFRIHSSLEGGNTPVFGNLSPVQEERSIEDIEQLSDSCSDALQFRPEMETPRIETDTAIVPDDHEATPRIFESTANDQATEQVIMNILQEDIVCANSQPITEPGHKRPKTATQGEYQPCMTLRHTLDPIAEM